MSDYTTPGGRSVPGEVYRAAIRAHLDGTLPHLSPGTRADLERVAMEHMASESSVLAKVMAAVIDAWEDAKAAPVPAVPSGPKWHRVPAWEINQGDEYVATVHTRAIARSYVARGQGYTATEVTKERMCVFDRSPEEVANAGYRCYMCDREG